MLGSCTFTNNMVVSRLLGDYYGLVIVNTNYGMIPNNGTPKGPVIGASTSCTLYLLVVPIPGWKWIGVNHFKQNWVVTVTGPNRANLLEWTQNGPGTESTSAVQMEGPMPTSEQKEAAATFLGYSSWDALQGESLDEILIHSQYDSWEAAREAYAATAEAPDSKVSLFIEQTCWFQY
ncbi:hypothetical protein BV25DRAFT_1911507 [Artomyces pyxidatus]|uniref:Uncharacterized protein n=1 Tax=Artomyces pyxidatus TaxID=48021 RepID=A0ACB8TGU3_9AGAM|nr:hypothetical protein BV25DRAFT_1911507 [Artomyces pyxidatus]